MKTFILTAFSIALALAVSAQVTLEKKYDYSTSIVKLETQGYKYYLMDVPKAQCRIYNPDHSLYKTINCTVPNNCYLADVKYISEKLFDSDAGLELLYTYYRYYTTSNSYYYDYDSKIINEDGSTILSIDGARYNYVNQTDANTYKLFSYCYDYSVYPEVVWTNIYSLPGTSVYSLINEEKPVDIDLFPNPAIDKVNVYYSLPQNVDEGVLHIVDNNGKLIDRYTVDNHTAFLTLDVTPFQDGIYHYFIEYNGTRTASKKLVVR